MKSARRSIALLGFVFMILAAPVCRAQSLDDLYRRGNEAVARANHSEALNCWNAALRIASDNENRSVLLANRGNAYDNLGQFDKALADYAASLRLDPDDGVTYYNRGVAYGRRDDFVKAIMDYYEAIRLGPKHAKSHNAAAWLLATCADEDLRDGAKAVKFAIRACELTDWENYGFIDTLAAAYAENGDFERAVKWQAKCCEEASSKDAQKRLELYKSRQAYHRPRK